MQTYSYNSIGNITSNSDVSYTYAGTGFANPHAATTIAGVTYTYDNNGNLTSAGPKSYSWDYRNRMLSSGNGTATSTYAYDHSDQRVTQIAAGITSIYPSKYFSKAGATTTAYVYAGDSLIATIETASTAGGGGTATSTGFTTAGTINESTGFTNFTTRDRLLG